MKRILSVVLLLALVLTVFPAGAMAADYPDIYDVSFEADGKVISRNDSLWYIDSIVAPEWEGVERWYSADADMFLNPGDRVWGDEFGMVSRVVFTPYVEVPEAELAEARIMDLGWAQFLVVSFREGSSLETCTLSVDGVSINDAVTPVTDDGSVVKWEITSLNHGALDIASEAGVQHIELEGTGDAPAVAAAQTPDYFLMNGPLYIWDYHLTNYDDAGNVRYEPSKTTFDLGVDTVSGATAYSPDAILHHDENALPSFVTGEVMLKFNYETDAEKAYVDGITDVDLVSADEYKNTLNDQLHYELKKNVESGDHVNAIVTVPLGQVNFTTNGRYNLRVTSGGKAQLFPIHVVEEVVPSMQVTGDQGTSGREVHLRISDMTYGATTPIYRVELRNPDGELSTLLKFDDWFLHGDLLVLYNDQTNHFPETGSYTVTVYANGFQPFSHTFWQNAIPGEAEEAPVMAVDAISTASVGGGGSSGGGDGDSKVMNANLIISSDLIANAKIVTGLGLADPDAEAISERWDSMHKLYAFRVGAEQVYDYDAYYDAVNTARVDGRYLTFAAYTASGNAVTTRNRPYAVKQVMEDNLLGETTGFIESVGYPVPDCTVSIEDDQAVIEFRGDDAYAAAVAAGQLTVNGDSMSLQKGKDYTLEGNVLTIKHLKYGKNLLSIRTAAYKTARFVLDREYPMEQVELSAADLTKGEPIVVKCTAPHENGKCDFLAHITGVQLVAPNGYRDDVMPQGAESIFEEIGYTVETVPNCLIIGKDTLLQKYFLNEDGTFAAGEYKIILTAEYYGDRIVTVHVADAEIAGGNAAPTVAGVKRIAPSFGGEASYRLSFVEENVLPYLKSITSITLNGTPARKVSSFWGDKNSYKFASDPVYGGDEKFIEFTADCFEGRDVDVVIHADGYEDLTFRVENGSHETAPAEAPVVASVEKVSGVMGQSWMVTFQPFDGITAYLEQAEITLNGAPAKKVSNLLGETNAFRLTVVDDSQSVYDYDAIEFTADSLNGRVEVVVTVPGFEPLNFTAEDGQTEPSGEKAPTVAKVERNAPFFEDPYYRISFAEEDVSAYLKAITSITVNGNPVQKVSTFWGDRNSYKFSTDPAYGGGDRFIDFTADCFSGDSTVVIQASGYQDLTIFLIDGQLLR